MEKTKKQKKINFKQILKKNWVCYLFILPMLIYVIIFNYIPMYGIQLAFKDYRVADGIWGSAWVGLKHFKTFFESYQFKDLLWNTLSLSLYSLIAGFPMPIIFALLLNYITNVKLKKVVQMVTYAPHFISTCLVRGSAEHWLGFYHVYFSVDLCGSDAARGCYGGWSYKISETFAY